ncbi:transcriptional regulator [Neisseria chenwenguii]|uniref:Transcriptional regulator n=1 Tax=Neisseria chenwenguii TaxID=1853278 RepID=A0A220S3B3_9NEIS|nr:transcriptional regulator [Neisseria chenwenguii]
MAARRHAGFDTLIIHINHRQPLGRRQIGQIFLRISVRTLYRDIETLRAQGADIRSEAGVGFVLHQDGFQLPPLMLTEAELEALVFGIRCAAQQGDSMLADAAKSALAKVYAVLPDSLADPAQHQALYPLRPQTSGSEAETRVLAAVRQAMRENRSLSLHYCDLNGMGTERVVVPVALGYFENARLLAAWCTLRQDFRHFRTDRISRLESGAVYPVPRRLLFQRWQVQTCVDLSGFEV